MEGIISLILLMYSTLMIYYHHALKKLLISTENGSISDLSIDLVIAYRNEEQNISQLLDDLQQLDKGSIQLTIYLIDDHSMDDGSRIIGEFLKDASLNIEHIHLFDGVGKKAAIRAVLPQLEGDWILFSDADCRMGKGWLKSYQATIQQNPESVCVLGPVSLSGKNDLFHRLQQLEFLSLQASTAAACLSGYPIMCNGANWMVKRANYLGSISEIKDQLASGDDMFVLHALKKLNAQNIVYNNHIEAVVTTAVSERFLSFWQQRMRWTAKSKYYTDMTTLSISALVLLANISFLVAFLFVFSTPGLFWYMLAKLGSEFLLIQRYANFFNERSLLKDYPFLAFFYPLYIVLIVWSSIFVKFQWKDRSYKA